MTPYLHCAQLKLTRKDNNFEKHETYTSWRGCCSRSQILNQQHLDYDIARLESKLSEVDFTKNWKENSFGNNDLEKRESTLLEEAFTLVPVFAYLSWKRKWDFLITFCPGFARPYVCKLLTPLEQLCLFQPNFAQSIMVIYILKKWDLNYYFLKLHTGIIPLNM